jgi:Trypsin-like peptidase domain
MNGRWLRTSAVCLLGAALVTVLGPMAEAGQRGIGRVKGSGDTWTIQAYRKAKRLDLPGLRAQIGATGRLTCPWGTATAFLVGPGNTFVTSAHVFVDLEPPHRGRKKIRRTVGSSLGVPGRCRLRFLMDSTVYRIAPDSLRLGVPANPARDLWPMPDWAVGRLDRPAAGVPSYTVSDKPPELGAEVTVVSQGMADFTPRVCHGRIEGFVGLGEGASFTTTCDVGLGASGGPVLQNGRVVGLTRGWIDMRGDGRTRRHLGLAVDPRLLNELRAPVPMPVAAPPLKRRRKIVSTSRP